MQPKHSHYADELIEEIEHTPEEYLPMLLRIVRIFRESVALGTAQEGFRQGWKEAAAGETHPVEELWDGMDTK